LVFLVFKTFRLLIFLLDLVVSQIFICTQFNEFLSFFILLQTLLDFMMQ